MNTLIVILSKILARPETLYGYLASVDGKTVAAHGSALAGTLAAEGKNSKEIVAVVPAEKLSWHRVTLPRGITGKSPRLRALLEGLLEEQLLDEPDAVHFAVESRARSEVPIWVAVCDRTWLRTAIQTLELAGLPVGRIVPEFSPKERESEATWHVMGTPDHAQLVITSAQGVTQLPFATSTLVLVRQCAAITSDTLVFAEPGVAGLAGQLLDHHPITHEPAEERFLKAVDSTWNLAQLDLTNSTRSRSWKRAIDSWSSLLLGRKWRITRWGVALLVVLNVAGLNALAWKEQSSLNRKRLAIREMLSQSFPKVSPIVDPPLQMARELALLRRSSGMTSRQDLESILSALSTALPIGSAANAIDFASDAVKIKGLSLNTSEVTQLAEKLKPHGYAVAVDGNGLMIKGSAEK